MTLLRPIAVPVRKNMLIILYGKRMNLPLFAASNNNNNNLERNLSHDFAFWHVLFSLRIAAKTNTVDRLMRKNFVAQLGWEVLGAFPRLKRTSSLWLK